MCRTAQRTTDTMRVLTLVTALVGLMGFSLAIAGMLVMVTGVLILVRGRRWLGAGGPIGAEESRPAAGSDRSRLRPPESTAARRLR